jgi:hypothetical protein
MKTLKQKAEEYFGVDIDATQKFWDLTHMIILFYFCNQF